jgi:glycerol kinase
VTVVQYRVVFGKKDEAVEGPDDAEIVVSVAASDAALNPTVAFMQGKLKATGSTGAFFALLKTAELSETLTRLSVR